MAAFDYAKNRLSSGLGSQFLVIALATITFEVALRVAGIPVSWVIIIMVAFLVGYAWYYTTGDRSLNDRNQVADNVYYLGFLYTVTALGFALFTFDQLGVESAKQLQSLVGDLGIGLATTVAGLILRVAIMRSRQSPDELEGHVTDTLRRQAWEVEQRFSSIIESFDKISSRFLKLTDTVGDAMANALRTLPGKIEAASQGAADRMAESYERVVAAVDAMADSLEKANEQTVQAAIERIRHSMDELAGTVEESVATMAKSFPAKMAAAHAEAVGRVGDSFNMLAAEAEKSVAELVSAFPAKLKSLHDDTAKNIASSYQAVAEETNTLATQLKSITANISTGGLQNSVDRISANFDKLVIETEKSVADLITALRGKAASLHDENSRGIASSYQVLADETAKLAGKLRAITADIDIDKLKAPIDQATQSLDSIMVPIDNLTAQVTGLSAALGATVQQLDGVGTEMRNLGRTMEAELGSAFDELCGELSNAKKVIQEGADSQRQKLAGEAKGWRLFRWLRGGRGN